MSKWAYKLFPLSVMHEVALVPIEPDAYVARSKAAELVEAALDAGYRWVRTEDGMAVLELETRGEDRGPGSQGTAPR